MKQNLNSDVVGLIFLSSFTLHFTESRWTQVSFGWISLAMSTGLEKDLSFHMWWRVDRSIHLSMFGRDRLHWSKTGQKNTQELLFHHTKLSQPCLASSGESQNNHITGIFCWPNHAPKVCSVSAYLQHGQGKPFISYQKGSKRVQKGNWSLAIPTASSKSIHILCGYKLLVKS